MKNKKLKKSEIIRNRLILVGIILIELAFLIASCTIYYATKIPWYLGGLFIPGVLAMILFQGPYSLMKILLITSEEEALKASKITEENLIQTYKEYIEMKANLIALCGMMKGLK
ncbi:MAG: hypothetical protein WC606_05815 [Candidatus Absconditabacterales bacterium]|jgi:hypothetical protein